MTPPLQTAPPTPAAIDSVFSEVLSRPEFRYTGTSPLERWLSGAMEFVFDLLRRWFPALSDTQVRWVQGLVFFVVLAGLVLLATRWARERRREEPRSSAAPGAEPELRDARAWRRWATSAAAEGRFREAATGLYQAVILHLDSRGAVRHRAWKTPGDYLDDVRADATLRARLRDFLEDFVEVAFGRGQPTPDAFEALNASADRLGCPT